MAETVQKVLVEEGFDEGHSQQRYSHNSAKNVDRSQCSHVAEAIQREGSKAIEKQSTRMAA